jgi:tetratricopeptide (TPR) repeat protein
MRPARFFAISCLTAILGTSVQITAVFGEVPQPETAAACCRSDIARWHKNADRLYSQFRPKDAVAELQKILEIDGGNFEALSKLARAYIDIGDMIAESGADWKDRKLKEYLVAEEYARKAVQADPQAAWGHFWVAAALGSIAMVSPVSKQVELAGEIRVNVERALARDPRNGPAYHIYGVWHRKLAEIGGASRMVATVLYGQSVPVGSLEKSAEYLRKAVDLNPTFIVSRLELARTHIARGEWEPARTLLRSISDLPVRFSDDNKHKKQAALLLAEIKDR